MTPKAKGKKSPSTYNNLLTTVHSAVTFNILLKHQPFLKGKDGKQKVYSFIHTDLVTKCSCNMISVTNNLFEFFCVFISNMEMLVCFLTLGDEFCCLVRQDLGSLTTCLLTQSQTYHGGKKSLQATEHLSFFFNQLESWIEKKTEVLCTEGGMYKDRISKDVIVCCSSCLGLNIFLLQDKCVKHSCQITQRCKEVFHSYN